MLTSSLLPSIALALCALSPLLQAAAVPLDTRDAAASSPSSNAKSKGPGKNFYLLAAPERDIKSTAVVGLSLFDPFFGENFYLRRQEHAAEYSQFNLTSGMLTTLADAPRTITPITFSSNVNATSGAVFFLQGRNGAQRDFSFDGKFLAYKNDTEGFTACDGDLDATVIMYKGTDASCQKVFVFKQAEAPSGH